MRDFLINLPWLAQVAVMFTVIIAAGCLAVTADEFFNSRRWARIVVIVRDRVQR